MEYLSEGEEQHLHIALQDNGDDPPPPPPPDDDEKDSDGEDNGMGGT